MEWKKHTYRVGPHSVALDETPASQDELDEFISTSRKNIEPWLSAVFQAEHLNVLIGSGFTTAITNHAGTRSAAMAAVKFGTRLDTAIDVHAAVSARAMNRGAPNVEDQFRSALAVLEGLNVTDGAEAKAFKTAMDAQLHAFLISLLTTERDLAGAGEDALARAEAFLQSFLLSFASRAASRERVHIFTTNYDRLIEHGCDLAGLRIIDRFVGALSPIFRSSRIEVDMHYNPPGIRGEPRFMEGVVRFTKLHGSLDWRYDQSVGSIRRLSLPFGAPATHTDMPENPIDTVMVYPNPAKDVETTFYPYAELFRDMAAALCRPNAVVVTYGYGFGDDHINRVLIDMLAIPSTHLVIIAYDGDDRIKVFCARTHAAQVSLLIGPHFASIDNLVEHYLPTPALDYVTGRLTELMRHRPSYGEPNEKAAETVPAGGDQPGGAGLA